MKKKIEMDEVYEKLGRPSNYGTFGALTYTRDEVDSVMVKEVVQTFDRLIKCELVELKWQMGSHLMVGILFLLLLLHSIAIASLGLAIFITYGLGSMIMSAYFVWNRGWDRIEGHEDSCVQNIRLRKYLEESESFREQLKNGSVQ